MIKIGETFIHSFLYSQEQVNTFAQVSGDTNPLHTDAEYAKSSMFGRCIMHGYLGGCVFTKLFGTLFYADGNIYMSQSMKFMKPMYADQKYEARLEVLEVDYIKNRAKIKTEIFDPETGDCTTIGEAMLLNKKQFVEG
ncbi:MAG: MaoC family dehydratase [Flavobacteriaceae bacterium]|nr:MaoC family dehydratase [Flavobacteriaceae bacterium]